MSTKNNSNGYFFFRFLIWIFWVLRFLFPWTFTNSFLRQKKTLLRFLNFPKFEYSFLFTVFLYFDTECTDSNNDYFFLIFQNKLGETSKEFIIQESYEPNCVVGLCGDFSSGSAGFKSELFSSILISLSIILMTVKWMNFFKALFYFIYKVNLTKFN